MNIVVCVKQVPDVDDIKWTKENNLDRANMLSKINPHDEWAIDWAVSFKKKFKDVKITALSMGPNQASDVLNLALAKGADRAILLSDKLFSGSDTLVTAKILAAAIKKFVPDFNLILTGHVACDGDTAQVPVSLAQLLSIVDIIVANEIYNADKNLAIAPQVLGKFKNVYEVQTPCLVAINGEPKEKYIPKIDDYIMAQNRGVEIYNAQDLEFEKNQVGVIGSPTMVYRAYRPEYVKNTQEITENYADSIIDIVTKANK